MSGDHSNVAFVRRKRKNNEGGTALPIGSSRGHQLLAVSCAAAAKTSGQKIHRSPLRPVLSADLKRNLKSETPGGTEVEIGSNAKRLLTEQVYIRQQNSCQRLLKARLNLTKSRTGPPLERPSKIPHLEQGSSRLTEPKEKSDCNGDNKENQNPVTGLIGMVNLGNTCYLNAVLQSLYRIRSLSSNVPRNDDEVSNQSQRLIGALHQLRKELNMASSKKESVNPLIVKEVISQRLTQFAGWNQQDAHECLLCILDILHEEYCQISGQPLEIGITPVSANFRIVVEHKFVCLQCSDISIRAESHYALSLDLFLHQSKASEIMQEAQQSFLNVISTLNVDNASENNEKPQFELAHLLDEYMRDRRLERNCDHCASKQCRALHQFKSLPEVLILHLKRFQMESSPDGELTIAKDKSKVLIPRSLKIGPAATHYKLSSIIEHHGPTPNSGHYIYDWLNTENDWYRFDDERVTRLSEQTSGDEYLIFYVKVQSN